MAFSLYRKLAYSLLLSPLFVLAEDLEKDLFNENHRWIAEEEKELFQVIDEAKPAPSPPPPIKPIATPTRLSYSEEPLFHFYSYVKHRESGGVGYNKGYTTLEGLLGFGRNPNAALFADVRLHLFDDAKFASNLGIGYRFKPWEDNSLIFGFNGYYDLRILHKMWYNQISAGFELFSNILDLRINGYVPISHVNHTVKYDFLDFTGNYLILNKKQRSAFQGGDVEVGRKLFCLDQFTLYAAIGSYYFSRDTVTTHIGAKARVNLDFSRRCQLQGEVTHDRLFKTRIQGMLAFHFPFGPNATKNEKKYGTCSFRHDMYSAPYRNEIVVIKKRKRQTIAKDANGFPFYFIQVNNLSPVHDGTKENPYSALTQIPASAPSNAIIYLNRGDGTVYTGGYVLTGNQKLLGSGNDQVLYGLPKYGPIVIPAATPGLLPGIVNDSGAGLSISGANQLIEINGVVIARTSSNAILAGSGDYQVNVYNSQFLGNTSPPDFANSNTLVDNCIFSSNASSTVPAVIFEGNFVLQNSEINGSNAATLSGSSISVVPSNETLTFQMLNNVVFTPNTYGLYVNPTSLLPHFTIENVVIDGNTFEGQAGSSTGGIRLGPGSTSTTYSNIAITANLFNDYKTGIYIDPGITSASGSIDLNIFNGSSNLSTDISPSTGGGLTVGNNTSSTSQ